MIMMHLLSVLLLNFKISSTERFITVISIELKENRSDYQSTLDMKDLSWITARERDADHLKEGGMALANSELIWTVASLYCEIYHSSRREASLLPKRKKSWKKTGNPEQIVCNCLNTELK